MNFNRAGGILGEGGRQVLSAAWGDADGDGRPDIYLAPLDFGGGELFLNKAAGFQRVGSGDVVANLAARAGAAWGDFDNDGRLDLLSVGTSGYAPVIYRNVGIDGWSALPLLPDAQASIGMVGIWVDYDNDGLLDAFTANGGGGVAEANKLIHNLGNGQFEVVKSGIVATEIEASHGAAFGDYDGDGDLDLFVAEAWFASRLYRNEGSGVFVQDVSAASQDGATSRNASTAAWGDLDNDGDLDLLVVTGIPEIHLYSNDGSGKLTKIEAPPLSGNNGECASAVMADFDNDGWLDVLLSNRSGTPRLFRGLGQFKFEMVDAGGLTQLVSSGNGIAVADYDRDGDLDVFIGNWPAGPAPYIFRNDNPTNSWLEVRLIGSLSNRDGIGAKVRIQTDPLQPTTSQFRQIGGFDSVGSQELVAHFGLGVATNVGLLRVEWPSGLVQELGPVRSGQLLTVVESEFQPLGPVRLNTQTGLYEHRVRFTSAGRVAATNGVRIFAHGLPAGVKWLNATGQTEGSEAIPFLQLSQTLARGQSIDLVLAFFKPGRAGMDAPEYSVEYGSWDAVVPPDGDRVAVTRTVALPGSGQLLVEFTSVPGARYAIEYSTNLEQWFLVPGEIVSGGSRTQWIDAGPPSTSTAPTAETQRFYRVVLLGPEGRAANRGAQP